MKQYLELCERILKEGVKKDDRTGTGTLSVFGHQMRFDLSEGLPLLTTKAMNNKRLDGIIYELLWFLNGDTNLGTLLADGVNIWNDDAYRAYKNKVGALAVSKEDFIGFMKTSTHFEKEHGDLGRIYGAQWRSWQGADDDVVDQIDILMEALRNNPDSRRHIITAWNPSEVDDMVLPPCHTLFQFYVAEGKLSCQLYQRSGDVFLGVPYNIASYALLVMMMAKQLGLEPGEFVHVIGDAHIYLDHVEKVKLQLTRAPKKLPKMLIMNGVKSIFDYKREDFVLCSYVSHPAIKGRVSVGD